MWKNSLADRLRDVTVHSASDRAGRQMQSPMPCSNHWAVIRHLLCQREDLKKHFCAIIIQVAQKLMYSGRENSLGEASITEHCQSVTDAAG